MSSARGRTAGMDAYDTPEAAALEGWDLRYAKVVRVLPGSAEDARMYEVDPSDYCVVELATNEEPRLYPYFIHCGRFDGKWVALSSHN